MNRRSFLRMLGLAPVVAAVGFAGVVASETKGLPTFTIKGGDYIPFEWFNGHLVCGEVRLKDLRSPLGTASLKDRDTGDVESVGFSKA